MPFIVSVFSISKITIAALAKQEKACKVYGNTTIFPF